MDTATRYCHEKVANPGSSFYYRFLFLPPQKRSGVMAVYAFCREVDDIVDECTDKDLAYKKLSWWQEEINRIFLDKPLHPVGEALCAAKDHFPLRKHLFEEILQGVHMDITYQGYETFEDLRLYCHCVASTAELLVAEISGYQDPATLEYAKNLGIAFQLVNIIREVGKDANRGRVYIPETELAKFSLNPSQILDKQYDKNFSALMQYQAERAQGYYEKALKALPSQDKHAQKSGIIMAEIYFTLLQEIKKINFDILHQHVSLTPLRKLWIAWKTVRHIKKVE